MNHLIGLTGPRNSGKSTVAKYLCMQYGFVEVSVAGPLKDVCSVLFGWPLTRLNSNDVADKIWKETVDLRFGFSPRFALQKIGTDLFRNGFDEEFWCKIAIARITDLLNEGKKVVVSDVRFDNEARAIRALNGSIVAMSHIFEVKCDSSHAMHASESGISGELINSYHDAREDASHIAFL